VQEEGRRRGEKREKRKRRKEREKRKEKNKMGIFLNLNISGEKNKRQFVELV
jgi:hypothetical protein